MSIFAKLNIKLGTSRFKGEVANTNLNDHLLDLARQMKAWPGYNADWYLSRYADANSSGLDPAIHYLTIGAKLGYDPAPSFNSKYYLEVNEDVRDSGINPLIHYLQYGRAEGRSIAQANLAKPSKEEHSGKNVHNLRAQKEELCVKTKDPIKFNNSPAAVKPRGNLDLQSARFEINGWLAVLGESRPREAILSYGGTENRVLASLLRSDLQAKGINEGRHSFTISLPPSLMDGKPHTIILADAETGIEVSRKTCTWERPKRLYSNFSEFLKSSMTQPLIPRPFTEEDKRSFAVMEGIANRLCNISSGLKKKPLVSVIMPVFNRANIVADAIRSVLSQEYKNFELLIIDDGSTDETIKKVSDFKDGRIKLLDLQENVGHARARNAGLSKACGDIVAYLDSDNTWDSRYLGAVVGAFQELPSADAIATGQLLYRGSENDPYAVRYGHLNLALLQNRNFIDLNAFSHRRRILQKIGGFDVSLRRFVDYDLALRISSIGKIYSVPFILSHYYFDKANETVTKGTRFAQDHEQVQKSHQLRLAEKNAYADSQKLKKNVSVVIPNWQSLEDIKDCLGSLSGKNWQGRLDVIVVDNNSDEEVVKYLRSQQSSGKIQLIENSDNVGFTYAVNQGINISNPKSDILILNNDAIVQPGAIFYLQHAAYALPEAGITVPRQILPAGTKTLTVHGPFADPMVASDANISAHHRNIESIGVYHDGGPVELNYAPFFATYVRRDVISSIGVLDAEYGRHYRSDRVYCDMMRQVAGRRIYYVPDAHVIHKLQKSTDTLRDKGESTTDFDLMFKRNQWTDEQRARFGFRAAAWDVF